MLKQMHDMGHVVNGKYVMTHNVQFIEDSHVLRNFKALLNGIQLFFILCL